ncbi:MAG: tyrosine-type recombinase/integrase [Bacteroidota bacterium]
MAFLNKKTSYYYTEKRLKGFGALPRLSLGTTRKVDASKFESALVEIDRLAVTENPAYHLLIKAILPKTKPRLEPAQLYLHLKTGRLEDLLRRIDDKPFEAILAEYKQAHDLTYADSAIESILTEYIGNNLWSEVTRAVFLDVLFRTLRDERGIKPNSVLRNYGRLLSKMIQWKEGKARRDDIFAAVKFASEDDTRRLRRSIVTRASIARLIRELAAGYQKPGDECATLYAGIAISQGVTPAVLPRCLNSDFRMMRVKQVGESYRIVEDGGIEVGLLELRGAKKVKTSKGTKRRDRPVWIAPQVAEQVRRYWRPDRPAEALFPLRSSRFYTLFKKARIRAGLTEATTANEPLIPHDLRSVFAFLAEEAGVNRSVIGFGGLGHTNLKQTDRYLARQEMMNPFAVEQILGGLDVEEAVFKSVL